MPMYTFICITFTFIISINLIYSNVRHLGGLNDSKPPLRLFVFLLEKG